MNKVAYLWIVMSICGTRVTMAAGCDCAACDDRGPTHWICVPQCTTASVKVTEWGVQTELICPPRGHLFCGGGAPDTCDGAGCDAGCDTCDAGCDDCGMALPGIGPRVRKKLMRKTLVYSVPRVQYVAQPDCGGCPNCTAPQESCAGLRIDFSQGSSPAESMAVASDRANVYWLNATEAPPTKLLTAAPQETLPTFTVARREPAQTPVKIHWIDAHDVEHVESLGTMSETLDIQPPAPLATQPAATDAAELPITSQTISIQR